MDTLQEKYPNLTAELKKGTALKFEAHDDIACEEFQELCFSLGIRWGAGPSELKRIGDPFWFFDGAIYSDDSRERYYNEACTEWNFHGDCVAVADRDSFFEFTAANWEPHDKQFKREPDFESNSGSKYWYTNKHVYRLSDHWGKVASCRWVISGIIQDNHYENDSVMARCKWKNFVSI